MPDLDPRIRGARDGRRAFVGPEQVVIDLTNRCNNNCLACWTNSPLLRDAAPGPEWAGQELPESLLLGLLEELGELGTRHVRFTGGGEPFMHPSILAAMRSVVQNGMSCAITTNFTKVTAEQRAALTDLPVAEIAVSLWAASGRIYSRLHPNKTARTFDRVTRDLSALLAARRNQKPRVTLCHVLNAINYAEFDDMVRYGVELGVDALYFTLVDPIPGRTDGLLLQPRQQERLSERVEELAASSVLTRPGFPELENFDNFQTRLGKNDPQAGRYDAHHIDHVPCYVGWIFARVMANGEVAPCCRGVRASMGDLHEDSFRSIWFSDRYNRFREMALSHSKSDPYFTPINCGATCDNLMHNQQFHARLRSASLDGRR